MSLMSPAFAEAQGGGDKNEWIFKKEFYFICMKMELMKNKKKYICSKHFHKKNLYPFYVKV